MTYGENFKVEAIKLSDEIGVKKASEQLNVNYSTLANWRKSKNIEKIKSQAAMTELEKVQKKRIDELETEVKILKDAFSFFVLDRKRK